jgi:hypothetical protein
MFSWIICARRPLQVDELREAIAFTIDDTRWDSEKIPNDLNRLIRACGNLILIDEETQNVQLAHYTVQQYLLDHPTAKSAFFHIIRKEADLNIGEVCVAYLSFPDFEAQLTKFSDTVTPGLTALEEAVATQPMITSTFLMTSLTKALARLRGAQHITTNIQYSRHINIHNRNTSEVPLNSKFSLLPYITENWLFHSIEFTQDKLENSASHTGLRNARRLMLFDYLTLEKKLLFDFRPWDCVKLQRDSLPYAIQIGWALSANHVPLLEAIANRHSSIHPIERYLNYATDWFFSNAGYGYIESVRHIAEAALQRLHKYSLEAFPSSGEWGGWMYHRIISACSQDGADALIFCLLKFGHGDWAAGTRSRPFGLFGHIFLEAARHGQGSLIRTQSDILSNWRIDDSLNSLLWITTDYCGGLTCNAIELAALSGYGEVMNLLKTAGCKVSSSFRNAVLSSTIVRETIGTCNSQSILPFFFLKYPMNSLLSRHVLRVDDS